MIESHADLGEGVEGGAKREPIGRAVRPGFFRYSEGRALTTRRDELIDFTGRRCEWLLLGVAKLRRR